MAQASQVICQRKESPAHECSLLCLTLLGVQEAHTNRDMEAKLGSGIPSMYNEIMC